MRKRKSTKTRKTILWWTKQILLYNVWRY